MALAPWTDFSYYNFWYGHSLIADDKRRIKGKKGYDLFND